MIEMEGENVTGGEVSSRDVGMSVSQKALNEVCKPSKGCGKTKFDV